MVLQYQHCKKNHLNIQIYINMYVYCISLIWAFCFIIIIFIFIAKKSLWPFKASFFKLFICKCSFFRSFRSLLKLCFYGCFRPCFCKFVSLWHPKMCNSTKFTRTFLDLVDFVTSFYRCFLPFLAPGRGYGTLFNPYLTWPNLKLACKHAWKC